MNWFGVAALFCGALLALAAVWTDLTRREIPHWIPAGLALFWLAAVLLEPRALNAAPINGLACGAGGLALGFVLHALGWLGGGDGKLLAVLALWLGPADLGLPCWPLAFWACFWCSRPWRGVAGSCGGAAFPAPWPSRRRRPPCWRCARSPERMGRSPSKAKVLAESRATPSMHDFD